MESCCISRSNWAGRFFFILALWLAGTISLAGMSSLAGASSLAGPLSLEASVNGVSAGKPGPLLATGSTAQIELKIRNTGTSALRNISINGRQKLPEFKSWRSLCSILYLPIGETASCKISQPVPQEVFKMLVVANTSVSGAAVQVMNNVFLRGGGGASPNSGSGVGSATAARLSLLARVNNQSSGRPGPQLSPGIANWIYTVKNEGSLPLGQIVIRARQKLPALGAWRTACTLNTLAPGASGQCELNETIVSGQYKALLVGRGISSNGDSVETLTNAFYRSSAQQVDNTVPGQNPTTPNNEPAEGAFKGYKSLFAGHSFFKPVAHDFTWLAAHAGFTEHQQTVVYSSGETGAPEALWNNDDKRRAIQTILNQGDVGLFGLTYHDDYPSERAYIQWADYAFGKNPDTVFFIAMPWARWPGRYSVDQMERFWSNEHENVVHRIVDTLRSRHPGKRIFCVPYGMASSKLKALQQSGNLPDVQQLIGDHLTSVYNDELGHTGVLMKRLSALVWLNAIYDVDLRHFDYHDPYITDLKTLASDIMIVHDSHYDN